MPPSRIAASPPGKKRKDKAIVEPVMDELRIGGVAGLCTYEPDWQQPPDLVPLHKPHLLPPPLQNQCHGHCEDGASRGDDASGGGRQ